jgi:L-erythrulose 1-phosphate isomerase
VTDGSVADGVIWVGTSWKMNKTIAETRAYCRKLARANVPASVQAFVLPPFTSLAAAHDELGSASGVLLGVQNAHWAEHGPWTGEISMQMVRDAGGRLVEIGHSERREHFGETDETVGLKVEAAVRHGLVPLVCVGEPRAVRDTGAAEEYVVGQLDAAVARLPASRVSDVIVAYEPVWAIGAAGTPATADLVAPVICAVADRLSALTGGVGCRALLYGGGVDTTNAPELLRLPHLDGLFVGRAAWDVDGLLALVDLAARRQALKRR